MKNPKVLGSLAIIVAIIIITINYIQPPKHKIKPNQKELKKDTIIEPVIEYGFNNSFNFFAPSGVGICFYYFVDKTIFGFLW